MVEIVPDEESQYPTVTAGGSAFTNFDGVMPEDRLIVLVNKVASANGWGKVKVVVDGRTVDKTFLDMTSVKDVSSVEVYPKVGGA